MSKFHAVTILLAAIALSAPLLAPVVARQDERTPNDASVKLADILKQMQATCQQLVELRTEEYQTGRGEIHQLVSAQEQLFDIELKLANTQDERKTVLEKHLELEKNNEKLVDALYRAGKAQQGDVLECQLSRMNVEMSILKEPN